MHWSEIRQAACVTRLVCLGLLLASWNSVGADSAAGETAEDSGIVVRLGSWWLVPRNIDLDYAFVLPQGGTAVSGGGELQSLSHSRSTAPVIQVGWRSGSAGREVGARFWEYEGSAGSSSGELPLGVGTLLSSPDFGLAVVDSANADFELRATLVDAGVTWDHDLRNGGSLGVFAGIRLFRFEEQTSVTYRRQFGVISEERIDDKTDASGIGPRVAVSYEHRWGRRLRLGVGVGVAFPVGELEGETQDTLSEGFAEPLAPQLRTVVLRPGSRQVFTHFDLALRFEAELGAGLTASVAYALQQWSGVRQTLRFIDNVGQSTAVPVEQDVIFEGPLIELRYTF